MNVHTKARRVLLVPGNGGNPNHADYDGIRRVFEDYGHRVIPVQPDWSQAAEDWVQTLDVAIQRAGGLSEVMVAGFSFGAFTAFVHAACKGSPAKLWLCSLSPFFEEDLLKKKRERLTKAQHDAFMRSRFSTLVQRVSCPVELFHGSEESSDLLHNRVRETEQALRQRGVRVRRTLVPGAEHDITDTRYVDAVYQALVTER